MYLFLNKFNLVKYLYIFLCIVYFITKLQFVFDLIVILIVLELVFIN